MPAANGNSTMADLITEYRSIKEQVDALEARKKEIATRFKAGLAAFGVNSIKLPVNGEQFQLRIATRTSHSCQWDALRAQHPELYTEFVSDRTTEYVDVRQVRNEA